MTNLESLHFYEPFTANIAGFIVPTITGLLSACSSGLIIYIISKSQQKLSTTYHRLMAFMSFFDIVSSIFIALGTIMLPSDTFYKFAGPMLGNDTTCQIQGWLIVFGLCGSTSLNACLAWYFVLKITFNVDSIRMRQKFEPFMYLYTLFFALSVPSYYLSNDLLNPNPYDSFCTTVPYPESCDEEKWYDWNACTWSETSTKDLSSYKRISTIVIGLQSALIVLGMSIILRTDHSANREEIDDHTLSNDTDSGLHQESHIVDIENRIQHLKCTRTKTIQALMYILAFFFTWVLIFFSGCFNVASFELDAINCFLFPLQGFWNLLIFFFDKIYLISLTDSRISVIDAVKRIVTSPSKAPSLFFSNISTLCIGSMEQTFESEKESPINGSFGDGPACDQMEEGEPCQPEDREPSNLLEYCAGQDASSRISFPENNSSMPTDEVNEIRSIPPKDEGVLHLDGVKVLGNDIRRCYVKRNILRRAGELKVRTSSNHVQTGSHNSPDCFSGDDSLFSSRSQDISNFSSYMGENSI